MNAAARVGGSDVVAGRGDLIRGGRGREGGEALRRVRRTVLRGAGVRARSVRAELPAGQHRLRATGRDVPGVRSHRCLPPPTAARATSPAPRDRSARAGCARPPRARASPSRRPPWDSATGAAASPARCGRRGSRGGVPNVTAQCVSAPAGCVRADRCDDPSDPRDVPLRPRSRLRPERGLRPRRADRAVPVRAALTGSPCVARDSLSTKRRGERPEGLAHARVDLDRRVRVSAGHPLVHDGHGQPALGRARTKR
jgi:hypothetical protein